MATRSSLESQKMDPSRQDYSEKSVEVAAEKEIEAGAAPTEPAQKPAFDVDKLTRKIDIHVLPILFLIYFVAFLDRVNVSNALTLGLPAQLGLGSQQPNIALTIFFVPYVLFEIPSNLIIKRLTPHIWLSSCVFVFGVVMIGQGFVRNFGGLAATRFLLGLAEAGVLPGSFYLISFWYTRAQAQRRFTFYWCSVIVAGAFGGLLATAISRMDGVAGLAGWRWIFILEGILTVFVSVLAFLFVSDFPNQARWLTEEEREYLLARARETDGEAAEKLTWADTIAFFKDGTNLLGAIMYFCIVMPIYSFAYFLPTIIQTLGYSIVQTQLHAVPPFAAALGFCVVLAILSDRLQLRFPFILLGYSLMLTGLSLLLAFPPSPAPSPGHGTHAASSSSHSHFSTQYAAVHLVCMGGFGAGASVVCWYLMNLSGHARRSLGSGWMVSFGNCGGVVATFAFLKSDSPKFRIGYGLCLGFAAVGTFATMGYGAMMWRRRRAMLRDGRAGLVPVL